MQWEKQPFTISTDPQKLELDRIHVFLKTTYWATDIPKDIVKKSLQHSLNFGLYHETEGQIGLARVVTDYATFAYLGDVYVEESWRGQGLSKWLMACVMEHPELQRLRRFCLGTKDAHELYKKYGFELIKNPENWLEIKVQDIYKTKAFVKTESDLSSPKA
ncbi:GNAT family N-acetyltransferase [bacterium]|jgi:GNAT superfamily N-acetyltransferase|nr:GNAT family N-acetyltransferase [bacterium]